MMALENKTKINCGCYLLFALFFIIFLTIYSYGVFFLNSLGIPYSDIGLIIGISALFSSILQPLIPFSITLSKDSSYRQTRGMEDASASI